MKIGPFTPPDVRDAIIFENEHQFSLPIIAYPDRALSIAGMTFHVNASDGIPPNWVTQRLLEPFLADPARSPDHEVFAHRVDKYFEIEQDSPGNVNGLMSPDNWIIRSYQWELAWDSRRPGRVDCAYVLSLQHLINSLRHFIAHQLLQSGRGLLLHAAAATFHEHTFIFLGHSGAGKSTSARTSPGHLLSDETVAVLLGADGRMTALGTPFGGEHFPSSIPGPDPVFLFLEKSEKNARRPISTRNAVARLLSQVVLLPFAPLNLWDQAAEMVERILENHPVEILEAKKDGSFWKELLS